MFGLSVMLFMTLSGHPWIINKMYLMMNGKFIHSEVSLRSDSELVSIIETSRKT